MIGSELGEGDRMVIIVLIQQCDRKKTSIEIRRKTIVYTPKAKIDRDGFCISNMLGMKGNMGTTKIKEYVIGGRFTRNR